MPTTFDSEKYRIPTGNIAAVLALARGLVSASRKDAPPLVRKLKKRLADNVNDLEVAWGKLDATAGGIDARLADNALDGAHAAIEKTLEMFTWLPRHLDAEDVEQAKALHDKLYAGGMEFLKLPYPEEWAESEKRVRRIHDEGLQPGLEKLCGKPLVAALFKSHDEYGIALGITRPAETILKTKVGEPFTVISGTITQYVRAVIGTVDEDEDDTVEAATAMLHPVTVYRDRLLAARNATTNANAKTPTDPLAPVPLPAPEPTPIVTPTPKPVEGGTGGLAEK